MKFEKSLLKWQMHALDLKTVSPVCTVHCMCLCVSVFTLDLMSVYIECVCQRAWACKSGKETSTVPHPCLQ